MSGFAIGRQTTNNASAISIKLGSSKPKETVPTPAPKTLSVAAAFKKMKIVNEGKCPRSKVEDEVYWKGCSNLSLIKLLQ